MCHLEINPSYPFNRMKLMFSRLFYCAGFSGGLSHMRSAKATENIHHFSHECPIFSGKLGEKVIGNADICPHTTKQSFY